MSLFPPEAPQTDFSKTSKLLYGFPKTGKTTLFSHMRDAEGRPPLFVQSEDGQGTLEISRVRVTGWDGFIRLLAHLEGNVAQLRAEHSSIVVDVVGDFDDFCVAHVCKKLGISTLADETHGKGFDARKTEFRQQMHRLMALLPVSFIAHTKEREIMWDNEKIKVQAPNLGTNCLEFLNGKCDTIMWIAPATSKKEFPEIIIRNSMLCIAGSRFPQIVRHFPFNPKNPAAAYAAIEKAFSDGFASTVPEPAKEPAQ